MRVKSIMDINEVTTRHNKDVKNPSQVDGFFQVQFYLTMKWFESRLKFQVIFSNHHWTRQASNTFHYILLPWIIPIKESNQISFFSEPEGRHQPEQLPAEWDHGNLGSRAHLWKYSEEKSALPWALFYELFYELYYEVILENMVRGKSLYYETYKK